MPSFEIRMKDGSVKEIKHQGRSGGSFTPRIEYKQDFVVICDEWDNKTSIPTKDIQEIKETPHYRSI